MAEDVKGARARAGATGQAAQGTAGAAGGTAGYTTQGFEGSLKQTTDVNTEEVLALLQSLAAKSGISVSDLTSKAGLGFSDLTALNAKRFADQAHTTDLLGTLGDVNSRQVLNQLTIQCLQNAVENANLAAKQAIRHADIAIDNQWNPVQQGAGDTLTARAVSIDDASLKAIGAAVAAALANALVPKP